MRKSLQILVVVATMLLAPVLFASSASALSHARFTLTSDPASAVVDFSHITTPPIPGESLTITENLNDENGRPAGRAVIDCTVVTFTTTDLLLACLAHFYLTYGTIEGRAVFWTFQHNYPAFIVGGTGVYEGVAGTARIIDRAPGDESYIFNLLSRFTR